MSIHVKFFASLRERMGHDTLEIDAIPGLTAGAVWRSVSATESLPSNVLVAVNQDYATAEQPVVDGDEVAFFPPVTGG